MADQLIRATAADNGIRVVGVVTTDLTQEARDRHQLSYLATVALGRAMAAGFLLASSMKQPQSRLNLRIKGAGALKGLMVDAGLDGTVRGYVDNPKVELPLNAAGRFDLGAALMPGYLSIFRDVGYGVPYNSTVELISGEIGDDVAYYLASSEQTPSALMLGVFTNDAGVASAGGLLVQVLPKAAQDDLLVALLESRISSLEGFSELLRNGRTLTEIMADLLGDLGLEIFPEETPLRFHCPCSRDRVLSALRLFGSEELRDMADKDNGAEATCELCGEVYQMERHELEALIAALAPSA
jgi:molecular chaperone Hsp33